MFLEKTRLLPKSWSSGACQVLRLCSLLFWDPGCVLCAEASRWIACILGMQEVFGVAVASPSTPPWKFPRGCGWNKWNKKPFPMYLVLPLLPSVCVPAVWKHVRGRWGGIGNPTSRGIWMQFSAQWVWIGEQMLGWNLPIRWVPVITYT